VSIGHDDRQVYRKGFPMGTGLWKLPAARLKERQAQFLGRTLLNEIIHLGYERKRGHLFLYTSPHNVGFFQGCGFYPLVEVPDYVTMLENTPIGIGSYCTALTAQKRQGGRIGAIVMDADSFGPFHRPLVRQVADDCDWLHVFVSADDPARDADRLAPARDVVRLNTCN